MATIITRETTAPGVTNNQGPLTNAQLDQNFINLNTDKLEKDNAPYLDFNTTAGETILEGKLAWDDGDGTLAIGLKGGITLKVGQEQVQRILNNTGNTLTKGQAVYITGAQGQRLTVALAQANAESTSSKTFAIVAENILNGSEGFISSEGLVRNINTTGIGEGSALYLSPITPGALTVTKPTAPNHVVLVGFCVRQHATNGSIFVKVQNGFELEELHNVSLTTPTNGQVLAYESSTGLWKNTASPVINYLPIGGGTLTGDLQLNTNYLRFDQVGTRSWNIRATGGNLDVDSGDNLGLLRYNGNTVIHSGNYNDYAPKKDGTGANGTWGISITGNAATVTDGITTTNYSSYALPLTGGTLTGLLTTRSTTGLIGVGTQGTPGIEVYAASGSGNAAYMTFHRPGHYAVRFGLDTDNVLKVGGWSMDTAAHTILHSGNFNSYALPLTGGDMTGRIRMGSFPNSTVNSGEAWIGRAADRSTGTLTVQLGNDAARVFEVVDKDWSIVIFNAGMNNFTYKGNTIYHSGNIPTWNQNTTGTARYSQILDTRAAQLTPNEYTDYAVTYEFTDQIVSGWHTAMTMQGWHDNYAAWQIIGPASTTTHENWYLRSGVNTTWGSLRTIVHSGNVNSYSLPIAGGTLTGSRPISFGTSGGSIEIKGDSGGWATGLYFIGSGGTNRGGFGGLGSGDSLTNFWIGPAYNNTWMTVTSSAITSQVQWINAGTGGSNTGIALYHGNATGDYGALRFYQAGSNNQTIHVFPTTWQSGTLSSTASGSINISGAVGVTFGSWNNVSGYIGNSGDLWVRDSISVNGNTVLHAGNYTNYALNNAGRIKTYYIDSLLAIGTQARRYEIARIGIDFNDWNSVGSFEIELLETYFVSGVKKRYAVNYGYGGLNSITLVEMTGAGTNSFRAIVGSPVQVSGDHYYLPVFVDVRYYSGCSVIIRTNRLITTSPNTGIGYAYINTSPSGSDIADFTPDSTVNMSNSASDWQVGGNTVLHSGNYTSFGGILRSVGYAGSSNVNWNGLGNNNNTIYQVNQETFNAGSGTGNTNFPTSRSYSYGVVANLWSGQDGRAQIYISHAGNDLIFRGGWGTESWQTWNKVLTDQNYSSYALPLTGGTVTGVTTFTNASDAQILLNGGGTAWAGISWTDSGGTDYTWYYGQTSTFAIGGGGSAVSGKKLHINGGTSIGNTVGGTAVPTNGLLVEGNINVDGTIGFRRASGDYGTYIKSNGYPGQGYANADGTKYWVELGSAGGVHVVLNTDGGADAAENSYDHFTIWQNSNQGNRQFYVTNIGNVWARNNITAYSDERVKTDWIDLPANFVDRLSRVKSGTYKRTDYDIRQVGVSAQSLQEILPEAVTSDDKEMLSVAYGNAALASCVELAKELVALKKHLTQRISELESKLGI